MKGISSFQPQISVIVPFYNAGAFLQSLLCSLKEQTFSDIEILLVDDHSTDGSCELCRSFVACDKRFKILSTNTSGPSAARNVGLANSTGKYVFFADADDTLERSALADLLFAAEKHNADFVIGDFSIINNAGRQCREKTFFDADMSVGALEILNEYLHKPAGSSPVINVWGRLYRTDRIKRAHLFFCEDMKTWEDTLFNIDFLNTCPKTFYHSGRIYNYYLHQGTQSCRSAVFDEPDGYKMLLEHIRNGALGKIIPPDELQKECNHFVVYVVVKTIFQCYNFFRNGKKNDKIKRKELKEIIAHYINDPLVRNALDDYHFRPGESRMVPLLLMFKSVILTDWWCWKKTGGNQA